MRYIYIIALIGLNIFYGYAFIWYITEEIKDYFKYKRN